MLHSKERLKLPKRLPVGADPGRLEPSAAPDATPKQKKGHGPGNKVTRKKYKKRAYQRLHPKKKEITEPQK